MKKEDLIETDQAADEVLKKNFKRYTDIVVREADQEAERYLSVFFKSLTR